MITTLTISCANCQAEFEATVQTIIDGGDLGLKAALLQDELNVLACPHCQETIQPLTPLYYYDPAKRLALALVPAELALSAPEQQDALTALATTVVNSLPKKQRKAYFYTPQVFTDQDALVEAILTADGITPALLAVQSARAQLLEAFLALPDERALQAKIDACGADLDRPFFELLTARIQAAQLQGDDARCHLFLQMRTRLGRSAAERQALIDDIDTSLGLTLIADRADLLAKLQRAPDRAARKPLVAAGFHLLDNDFFKLLSRQFEQAAKNRDDVTERTLRHVRTDTLELKATHSKASQLVLERAEALFKEVVQSSVPDQILKQKVEQINESFFFVLGANIAKAQQQGQVGPAQALTLIGRVATDLVQKQRVASGR